MPVQFDTLHALLTAGLIGFVSALAGHVITKWRLVGKYITREEYDIADKSARELHAADLKMLQDLHRADMKEILAQCQLNKAHCPITDMQKDLIVIKATQTKRTADLEAVVRQSNRRRMIEMNIWRAILEALNKNVHEQNDILEPLNEFPN